LRILSHLLTFPDLGMASPAQDQHQRSSFRDILHNWKTAEKQYSNGIEMLDRDDMNQLKDMFTYFAKLEGMFYYQYFHTNTNTCLNTQAYMLLF
jgi:hypothetical protein